MSSRTNLCDLTISSGLSLKESAVSLGREISFAECRSTDRKMNSNELLQHCEASKFPNTVKHRNVRCSLPWWAAFCPTPVLQTTFKYPFVLSSNFTASSALPKKENAYLQAVTIKLLAACEVRTDPCLNLLYHADLLHIRVIITIPNNTVTGYLIISSPAPVGVRWRELGGPP